MALKGETIRVDDAYACEDFDFSGTRRFDETTGYRSRSFLTVPMKDHSGTVVGVLQLINELDANDHVRVRALANDDQQLVESLASQAAIALNNRLLVEQLGGLLESLINAINVAIDEKSPLPAITANAYRC